MDNTMTHPVNDPILIKFGEVVVGVGTRTWVQQLQK